MTPNQILLFIIIVAILMISTIYLMIRNQWVYEQQLFLIHNNIDKAPSYNEMLFKYFYIWNIDKLIKIDERLKKKV